jgi:STE24 endopeptidase
MVAGHAPGAQRAGHRGAVPAPFDTVPLPTHQRAADYTLSARWPGRDGLRRAAAGLDAAGRLDLLNTAVRDALQPRFGDLVYQLGSSPRLC